jgi:hypothetical protein
MLQTQSYPAASAAGSKAQRFADVQRALVHLNRRRLEPTVGEDRCDGDDDAHRLADCESEFLDGMRLEVSSLVADVPMSAAAFVAWFEELRRSGPGQGDPLFPWLAQEATLEEMRWFLSQEVAGEAGFDDLVALTQVKMPVRAKLEMARNYWDEMGRGGAKGMHGPMLTRLASFLAIAPTPETTVPEALALNNLMVALAYHRHFAFHSVGALGVIEMTAPTRVGFVNTGLKRLGVPAKERHYFALHATLDVRHSQAWNREVLMSLVQEDGRRARAIGEGALLRLFCGKRCFEAYRRRLKQGRSRGENRNPTMQ